MRLLLLLFFVIAVLWATLRSGAAPCPRATPFDRLTPGQVAETELLQRLATQFLDHCTARHGPDPRVQKLVRGWNRAVVQSDFAGDPATVWATFNKTTGCLMMRMDAAKGPLDQQLGVMLHELAHVCGTDHDDEWKDCYLYFLAIATQELGWTVTLRCPTVCKSHAICARSNCDKCGWFPSFDACVR